MNVFYGVFKKVEKLFSLLIAVFIITVLSSSHSLAADFLDIAVATIEKSPEVNIALKDIELAEADQSISLSGYLPQLTMKAEAGTAREEYQDDLNTYEDLSASVNLSQELLDMSKIYGIKGADKRFDGAAASLIEVKQDVLLELLMKWGEYWKAKRQQEVNKENLDILNSYRDAAKTRFDAGELTITDVRLAESRYQTALSQKLLFLREERSAKEALEQRMDSLPPSDVALFELDIDAVTFPEIEEIIQVHPSMVPMKIELLGREIDIQEQRAKHLPTLKTVARYKYQGQGEEESSRYSYDEGYVGLELNLPIYTGGNVSSQVKKTLSKKSQQLQKIHELRLQLSRDIQTAKSDFEHGAAEEEVTKKRLEYAEETLKWMTEEFDAGTRTSVDVFLTQSDMINAKLDLVATHEQAVRFAFRYLYSMGMLNINTLKQYQSM